MRSIFLSLIAIATVLLSGSEAQYASSISQCPSLPKRATAATSVSDLRPDDIKVVGALGDSIMAGFAAAGITGSSIINISSIYEYRGVSYGAGGDSGAVTIPNFFKNYNSNLKGASVGKHLAEICYGPLCFPLQYRPLLDVLNAAQSAAMAPNLDHELDYLISAMKLLPGVNYKNDWKFINVQIGSNDQCASCINSVIDYLTPERYGEHMTAAVERIRNQIPRVIVNLIGVFNVSQVYTVTSGQSYCEPFRTTDFQINTVECPCAIDKQYRPKMDEIAAGYTSQIASIANRYKAMRNDSFAVMFTPANIKVSSFPLEGFSTVDCFHPSTAGHEWVAKSLWNTLFTPLANKPSIFTFDNSLQVYCPTAADRIQLD